MAVTEKDYLESSSNVKAARKKLTDAKAALSSAEQAKNGLPASADKNVIAQVNARIAAAEKALQEATKNADAIEAKAKAYYAKNKDAINAKATAKEEASTAQGLQDQQAILERMRQAGLDTSELEAQIAKKTAKSTTGEQGAGTQEQPVTVDNFASLIKDARKDVKAMSDAGRLDLANKLNSIGINVPKSGQFTDLLVQGYQSLITGAQNYYKQYKEFPTVDSYLAEMQRQYSITNPTAAGGVGGAGKAGSTLSTGISAATEAAGLIQKAIQSRLNREATPKEIADLTAQLNAAEKKNPSKTTTDAKGNIVYSGGIDRAQFLDEIIKAMPEFATKKAAAGKTVTSTILATAMDNNLNPSASQLATWTQRVQNGEDIKTIQNEIRTTASTGYPEQIKKLMAAGTDLKSILNPYINAMATTLQINPNTISLNDPILNQAISTPDGKEMTLYQYQTALRKDPRWQYTDAARSEASDVATKVLKDFGFMG